MADITGVAVHPLKSVVTHQEDNATTSEQKVELSASEKALSDHGADAKTSSPQNMVPMEVELWWSRFRHKMREPFSEFFGVFILILFGEGAIAQFILANGTRGDWQSVNWAWGIGVMLGVYISGPSGGHLNPAITFTNCIFRKFPWQKFPIYMLAQTLGAFCASAIVYANFKSAIDLIEGHNIRTTTGEHPTAGIFSTYPTKFMTRTGMFFSEFIASTILMFCLYALQDNKNVGAGKLTPLGLFFVVFGIGACFGWETGYAMNFARDFGPRVMSAMVGYGAEVFRADDHYFWIPMLAPFFGCTFGGWLYDVFLFTGDSPVNTPWMGLKRLMIGRGGNLVESSKA
ncbi:hypothetical protein HYFRA_00010142 [Hymenoscyphus fraxineus]|uniref:Aquaporin n=1 Tax=Hymenoscyphus fraxineus TaxID=746836 RepID=A0A9N9KTW9_9HELO|nr:hypothetical protein HYFRA_00010142 [Hymenoscyphus fraxineus]